MRRTKTGYGLKPASAEEMVKFYTRSSAGIRVACRVQRERFVNQGYWPMVLGQIQWYFVATGGAWNIQAHPFTHAEHGASRPSRIRVCVCLKCVFKHRRPALLWPCNQIFSGCQTKPLSTFSQVFTNVRTHTHILKQGHSRGGRSRKRHRDKNYLASCKEHSRCSQYCLAGMVAL